MNKNTNQFDTPIKILDYRLASLHINTYNDASMLDFAPEWVSVPCHCTGKSFELNRWWLIIGITEVSWPTNDVRALSFTPALVSCIKPIETRAQQRHTQLPWMEVYSMKPTTADRHVVFQSPVQTILTESLQWSVTQCKENTQTGGN